MHRQPDSAESVRLRPLGVDGGVVVPGGEVTGSDTCSGSPSPEGIRLRALLSGPMTIGGNADDVLPDGTGGAVVFSRLPS